MPGTRSDPTHGTPYRHRAALPEPLLQQLIRTRSFHAGLQMLRQLEFALV